MPAAGPASCNGEQNAKGLGTPPLPQKHPKTMDKGLTLLGNLDGSRSVNRFQMSESSTFYVLWRYLEFNSFSSAPGFLIPLQKGSAWKRSSATNLENALLTS